MSDPAPSPGPIDESPEPRAHEEAIVRRDAPETASDPRRSTRTGRRAGSRTLIGFVIGPIVGALLGLLVGALAFGGGSRGFWAAIVAGAIFGLLGGFWGGMSALGPPEVENDPLTPADRLDAPPDRA
jgi:uncharacterized protein YcfJ